MGNVILFLYQDPVPALHTLNETAMSSTESDVTG